MVDLVMGAAVGYDANQIRPFLASLRRKGYLGRIVLWANGEALLEARKWDVEVQPVPPVRTLPHAERFLWMRDFLKKTACQSVFLTDTRDVFFQKNPALTLPGNYLHVFQEAAPMTLGSCPYNSEWIRIGYGQKTLELLKDLPILCVGSISGSRTGVLEHLDDLADELAVLQPKTRKPQDQSCHNVILRRGDPDGVNFWDNEQSEVYTVGYLPRESVAVVDGTVRNKAGEIPTVVHQWDRHQNLSALVKELYL